MPVARGKLGYPCPLLGNATGFTRQRPMNLLQILLRLLLCIGLVLNGSAYAMAGGPMQGEAHDSSAMATDRDMAMSDCHDSDTTPEPAELPQPDHAGHDGSADCCQGGDSCHCDCQHHSPATTQQVVMLETKIADTRAVPGADAGRVAPPPQRLIRPPIAA